MSASSVSTSERTVTFANCSSSSSDSDSSEQELEFCDNYIRRVVIGKDNNLHIFLVRCSNCQFCDRFAKIESIKIQVSHLEKRWLNAAGIEDNQ